MTVLIVSAPDDVHVQALAEAFHARGYDAPELLDISQFPEKLALSMRFEKGTREFRLSRRSGASFDLDDVHSVWWRRPQAVGLPASSAARRTHAQFIRSEWETALHGLYHSLRAFWVNEPMCDAVAAHKPWQLTVAQQSGLSIPVTLMTSDPADATRFWKRYPGCTVFKQFLALQETWRETRIVGPRECEFSEAIRLAPVIFQQYVEGIADVRVTAVGRQLYASAASLNSARYPHDIRMNPGIHYVEHELPQAVRERLLQLMSRLGLVYGAIDLRLTAEHEYVFLEVNPAGQYLFVDPMTSSKVSTALADILSNAAPPSARPGPANLCVGPAVASPVQNA